MKLPDTAQAPKTKVKRSSAGLGLFALEDIAKGAFIIEYTGKVLSNAETQEKGGKYLYEVNSRKTIDGSSRSNTARYINHSCRPNAETEILKGRVFVYAKKKILAGDEITYDYGKDYFNAYIKPYGCRCEKCTEKKKSS